MNTEKTRIEDPCLKCDTREECISYLTDPCPLIDDPESMGGRSLLQQIIKQSQQGYLKYKQLIETAPDAIFVADIETGIVLEANTKASELLGIPVEQIIGMHQSQLHPPEEAQQYKEIFQEHVQKKSAHILEDVYVCNKDGKRIPVQISASVATLGDQAVIYGIFRNTTEQKQKAQELKASEARFKRLSEAAFEAIAIYQEGKIIDVNQQYLDMFGYTLEETLQIPGIEMIAPQSRELVKEKMASKYEGAYEAFGIKKDGIIFPVEIQAKEAVLYSQHIRIGVIRDLTEQKKLQKQLAESERKYRELYKNAAAALFRTRISDGMLLDCSQATAGLFGYDNEDEYKNNFSVTNTYVDPQQRQSLIKALKKDKRVKGFEVQIKRKDGTPIWIAISAEISPEKDYMEGVMQDITVIKVLSKTEKKILYRLMKGQSNKEIAYKLNRSVRTVEDHRSHIMRKLGVDNIVDLTLKAIENGIVPDAQ